MSSEPSYPQEAAVGENAEAEGMPAPAVSGGETLGVVVSARESSKSADSQKGGRTTRNFVAGAAVGVGSAALVAALLYANRSRRGDGRSEVGRSEDGRGDGRSEKDPGVARLPGDPQD